MRNERKKASSAEMSIAEMHRHFAPIVLTGKSSEEHLRQSLQECFGSIGSSREAAAHLMEVLGYAVANKDFKALDAITRSDYVWNIRTAILLLMDMEAVHKSLLMEVLIEKWHDEGNEDELDLEKALKFKP